MKIEIKTGIVWESKPGFAKVHFDEEDDTDGAGFTSNWLPQGFMFTKGDREVSTLVKGTQVKCLMENNMQTGTILCAIYSMKDTVPAIADNDNWVKEFEDGTLICYNKKTHKLKVDVKGDVEIKASGTLDADVSKDITVKGGAKLSADITGEASIKASKLKINGDVEVTGKITATQNIESDADVKALAQAGPLAIKLTLHKHSGVQTGAGSSGPAIP